jgi:hypothetical protein
VIFATAPLAHLGHSGGAPNYPLLIAAGASLLVGLIVGTSKRARPWMSWTALGGALAFGGLALALPESSPTAPGNVQVQFLAPTSGATVPSGEPVIVTVAVRNAFLATSPSDTSGGHLHLYVDGGLQQMPYSTQTQIELPRGEHQLRIEYVDFEHTPFDPPIETTISVTAR